MLLKKYPIKKQILLILLTFSCGLPLHAQISASYSAGYGSYHMGGMKDQLERHLHSVQGQIPGIPFEIVDNFPAYITHNANVSYRIKRHEMGLQGSYLTTGGRIAYSDYSGEYSAEYTLYAYRLGIYYRFYIPLIKSGEQEKLHFFLEISPGILFNNFKADEYIRIFEESNSPEEDVKMKALGFSALPQIGFKWDINPYIGLFVSGGLDLTFSSNFKSGTNKSYLDADWTGIRAQGGVIFTLPSKK